MSNPGQLPTAQDAFGPDTPTPDQAFPDQEHSGGLSDYLFNQNPFAHVMKAFGQGFEQQWGSEPLGLSQDSEKELRDLGIFNDYNSGRTNLVKSFNEAVIRPTVSGLDFAQRLIPSLLAGASTAATQAGQEEVKTAPVTGRVIGAGLGTVGELLGLASQGAGMEFIGPGEVSLSKARAEGAIGESQGEFFGTKPLTDAQAEARARAIGELHVQGQEPDIHNLARQIAPETMAHYDGLLDRQDFLSRSITALRDAREEDPDVQAAQGKIDDILDRVNGDESELSDQRAEELSKARDEKDELLRRVTPEEENLQSELRTINDHLTNLGPDVRYAYSEAQKALSEASGKAPETVPPEEVPPTAPGKEVTPEASKGLSGEIASDASQKLQEAGRPLEEADAIGQLIEAHYQARADRFQGKLGTARELYDRDFPEIIQGGKMVAGKTLNKVFNQAGLRVARRLPDGTVRIGEPGQLHTELYDEFDLKDQNRQLDDNRLAPENQGFATPDGKYLTREEALNWVKENQPKAFEQLKDEEIGAYAKAYGKLESVEYDLATGLKSLGQGQRGSITLREGRNLIRLFKDADASTFLHETGHQWLEELQRDALHPEAPEELKQDLQTVKDYVGNHGDGFTRAQHEKFARSFERYLREGIAPSKGLNRVFEKFRKWLTAIYQKVSQLRAPINDDIRGVFDRLIVTPRTRETLVIPDRKVPEAPGEITSETPAKPITEPSRPVAETPAVPAQEVTGEATSTAPATVAPTGTIPTEGSTEGQVVPTTHTEPTEEKTDTEETTKLPPVGNIRVENITSDGDLQQYIRQFYEEHKDQIDLRRGKISDSDLLDLAEAAGLKASDINVQKLQQMSRDDGVPYSARVLGLRQAFLESAEKTFELSRQVPFDVMAYTEARQRHLWLQETLTQVTGEAGRTLRVFRSLKGQLVDAQAMSEFFQRSTARTPEELTNEAKLLSNLQNKSQVSGFIRDTQKASFGEMALEFFRNNLISGPVTHMTYAAGNKLFALYKAVPETLAKAVVGKIHETVVGHPIERAYAGEVGEGLWAMLYGQRDGLKAAYDSFKAGQTLPLPGEDTAATPFTRTRAIPGALGTVVRIPGERMVAPIHSFDRTVGYLTNRAQLIYRRAYSEGLRGDDLSRRIAELESDTPDDIVAEAGKEATSQSLMGRPGELTRRFLSLVRWEANPPLIGRVQPFSFIDPFVTVISNINREALLERGPLAVVSKSFWENVSGKNGTLAQDSTIAKVGLGTALLGAAAGLLLEGKTTPSASTNRNEATLDEMVSGMPHSIRIGNMAYQFNRLGILGTMMAMATDLAYAGKVTSDTGDYSKGLSVGYHALMNQLTQEGVLSGVSDLMKAVDDENGTGAKNFLRNFAFSFVPFSVAQQQLSHLSDPYMRDTKAWLDALKDRTLWPGTSNELEPRIDIFGQPIPNKEYYGVYAEQVQNDPVVQAFKQGGYFPAPVERKINGVPLNAHQYAQYAQKAGVLSKMMLNQIVSMPNFNSLSEKTRHDIMKEAVDTSRRAASNWVMMQPENHDIITKSIQMKQGLTGK